MSESLSGQKLGAYRVGELIGEGAMGEVYRGVHEELGRRVAIKTLKRSLGVDPELVARMFAEARAVNIICHENIVECTDLVHDPAGRSYIVMELLEGRTLAAAMRSGRMPPQEAARIAAQIADAIGAAHDKGIVHRDLKPDNVFLIERAGQSDYVKVLDFGIARLQGLGATEAGTLIGTPAYMSPEQACGERAVPASDIYALGVILFQLVTGKLPLPADTLQEMLAAHISKKPPRADALAREVPAALSEAIDQALAKTAGQRPESMHAFRAMILRAVDLPVRPSKRNTPVALALETTQAPGSEATARTEAPGVPSPIGTTSLSNASGEASLQNAAKPRRRTWLPIGALVAAAAIAVAIVWRPWRETVSQPPPVPATFDDLVTARCNRAADSKLTCEIEVAPEQADKPEARPWVAYVNIAPQPGVTLSDERGCGRVATMPAVSGEGTRSVYVVTDCLLAEQTAHGFRTRLTATKDGVTSSAPLELAVATPAAQHNQGYRTLLSNRSYTLADVWFLDAEKRAEQVLASDPEATHIVIRSIYYRAYTHYMRLVDCSMRHRVEGRACDAADMHRWLNEAIRILEGPLALALRRPNIPEKQSQRQQNDRQRLENEILLRFSKGKVGIGTSVFRKLQIATEQCSDFVQQTHAFLATIAVSEGRNDAALQHAAALLKNLKALPERCAPPGPERDSLIRSANALLLAEYGVCGGEPVLKDVTAFACALVHEYRLKASGELANACANTPHERDDDVNATIRLLVTNMRRRNAGQSWRGGCHQNREPARAPSNVTGATMDGDPDALVLEVANVALGNASWHYVIDANGQVDERRPLSIQGAFPGTCAKHRSVGIAVADSPLAKLVAEELVDELRARYAIPPANVFTTANPARCE